MNIIPNIIVLIIAAGFTGAYVFNLVLNIMRSSKVAKQLKNNPNYVEAKVIEVKKVKNRVYVRVEYISKSNMTKFNDLFEFTIKEFNEQYYEGQIVKIYYPHTKDLKKVNCFPTFLEGQKLGFEAGPIVTDVILVIGGLYIFIIVLLGLLQKDPVSGLMGLQWNGRPLMSSLRLNTVPEGTTGCFDGLYILIIVVFYAILFSYLIERLLGLSANHKQAYLKLCGIKGTAEVKTFKFSRSKNAQGVKEANMKIEFFTNSGEKVECDLSSFLYSETQEQYIDILYDEKNPKNVVYMRK